MGYATLENILFRKHDGLHFLLDPTAQFKRPCDPNSWTVKSGSSAEADTCSLFIPPHWCMEPDPTEYSTVHCIPSKVIVNRQLKVRFRQSVSIFLTQCVGQKIEAMDHWSKNPNQHHRSKVSMALTPLIPME